ncbi:MAG: hypothetical protein ACO1SV_25680 [Fimbriimonas sp.]
MLFELALAATISPSRLLVTRVVRQRVEIVLLDEGRKSERILHSHRLSLRKGTTIHDENHNESLHRSLACAINPSGTAIAVLELVSSKPAPRSAPEESPEPHAWTSRANLITVDLRGRVVRVVPTEIRARGELFLGFADDGQATLVEETYPRQFRVRTPNGWRSTPQARLPRSFQAASHFPPRPDLEGLIGQTETRNPLFPGSIYRTPAWFDTGLPTFGTSGSVLLPLNSKTDAALASSMRAMAARWGTRTARLATTGRAMEYAYPLDYPWVIGRISPELKLLPEFANYPIVPMDPFIESTIWKLNLVTGERVRIGNGIHAIPFR